MLNLEQKAFESANKAFGLIEDMTWDMDKEFHNYHQEAFKEGYNICQKEYEEKLRWIPVEERLPEIGIWIIIQLKNQSLKNKYVTMLPKNDFEINFIKENVISWRSFL